MNVTWVPRNPKVVLVDSNRNGFGRMDEDTGEEDNGPLEKCQ